MGSGEGELDVSLLRFVGLKVGEGDFPLLVVISEAGQFLENFAPSNRSRLRHLSDHAWREGRRKGREEGRKEMN